MATEGSSTQHKSMPDRFPEVYLHSLPSSQIDTESDGINVDFDEKNDGADIPRYVPPHIKKSLIGTPWGLPKSIINLTLAPHSCDKVKILHLGLKFILQKIISRC